MESLIVIEPLSSLPLGSEKNAAEALCLLDDGFAERDPALFALAHSAVTGLVPAGPEHRERIPIPIPIELRGSLGVTHTSALCAAELGFSHHAATTARADDVAARVHTRDAGDAERALRSPAERAVHLRHERAHDLGAELSVVTAKGAQAPRQGADPV